MVFSENKSGKQDKIVVTLPVSDTIPGPGNYTVEVLNMDSSAMPVVNSTDVIDSFGAGTAQDISSTEQAPETAEAENIHRVAEEQDEKR